MATSRSGAPPARSRCRATGAATSRAHKTTPPANDAASVLATERRRGAVGAWIATTPHTQLHAVYSQERKTGVVETYRDAFYQAAALPQPIDQRTQELLLGWRYRAERALLDMSFERRLFTNGEAALVWQNPYQSLVTRPQRRCAGQRHRLRCASLPSFSSARAPRSAPRLRAAKPAKTHRSCPIPPTRALMRLCPRLACTAIADLVTAA